MTTAKNVNNSKRCCHNLYHKRSTAIVCLATCLVVLVFVVAMFSYPDILSADLQESTKQGRNENQEGQHVSLKNNFSRRGLSNSFRHASENIPSHNKFKNIFTVDDPSPVTPESMIADRNRENKYELPISRTCNLTASSLPIIAKSELAPPNRTDGERFGIDSSWWDDKSQTTESSVNDRVFKLPMAIALRQFSRASWDTVKDETLDIMCNLRISASNNCNPWKKTLAECVMKFGMKNFDMILGARCTKSEFWKSTLPNLLRKRPNLKTKNAWRRRDAWKKMNRGAVWDSVIMKSADVEKETRYIPPQSRTLAPFPPPRVCKSGCKHYPVGFGVPLSTYEKSVPRTKSFGWMPLLPKPSPSRGPYEANIDDEDFFHEMQAQSFFGWSARRSGFESLRSHQLLAAGSIPFFWDIDTSPSRTLGHYPKELLVEAMNLPGVDHMRKCFASTFTAAGPNGVLNYRRTGDIRRSNDPAAPIFKLTKYYELADKIHLYARTYMTTRAVAAYVLKTMGAEDAKTAVFFSRGSDDYLEMTILHGLVDLGIDVTVVSEKKEYQYLFKHVSHDGAMIRSKRDSWLRTQQGFTYGNSFSFQGRFPEARMKRNWIKDPKTIAADLRNGKFDVAIWSLSGLYYEFIKEAQESKSTKLAFLQFRDLHGDPDKNTMDACTWNGTIFIREMSDLSC